MLRRALPGLVLAATMWPAGHAVAQTAPAAAPVDRSQEIVCRRDRETGSLVKVKKTCHTRAQWQYIDETNQAITRQMADDQRTRSTSN